MKYSTDVIEQVISANDIVDVISEYVTLKRAGSSLKCCCPFHNEKTPSFVVTREKQLYHCFGCGVGGNVVNFIMDIEKLSFVEALKYLAERAHIPLPQDGFNSEVGQKRDRLIQMHRDAAIFYYKNLLNDARAQNYLRKRKIETSTVKRFGLGYAPGYGNSLVNYMMKKGYSSEDLVSAGLAVNSSGKKYSLYDRFRDRIMFPILSVTNKVVGFGGRIIDDEKFPKYLNSPETMIFKKGQNLYGLNNAKKHAQDQIIIVEGYMDVIGLYQKGVENAVASLGTAFTHDQGKLLKRYTKQVLIMYDGDKAGQEATSKAIEILKDSDLDAKVVTLPNGLDPDEYVAQYGKESFEKIKSNALSIIEYKITRLKKKYDLNNVDDRIKYAEEAAVYLREIQSSIEIEAYLNKISEDSGISKESLIREIKKYKSKEHKNSFDGKYRNENQKQGAYAIAQEKLLKNLVKDYSLYSSLKAKIEIDDFQKGIYRKLAEYLFKKIESRSEVKEANFILELENSEDVKIASSIFTTDENIAGEQDIINYINTIKKYKLRNEIEHLQRKLLTEDNLEQKNIIFNEIKENKRKLENIQRKEG